MSDVEFIQDANKIYARKKPKKISPLHYYHYSKKEIDTSQFSAGERFYESYRLGWHGSTSCEHTDRTDGGKSVDIAETRTSAKQDYARARKVISRMGSKAREVADRVLIDEFMIFDCYNHWYARCKAKKILHEVLSNLAMHYGYKSG